RFDSSPQCYSRDAGMVSRAGADDFMFDLQIAGRSVLTQGGREGTIEPGCGVLYDARRPFEDRLDGPEQRAEVLIVIVPAAALLRAVPGAEQLCAVPIRLSGAIERAVTRLVRSSIASPDAPPEWSEADVVASLAALLRQATVGAHQLSRAKLFA